MHAEQVQKVATSKTYIWKHIVEKNILIFFLQILSVLQSIVVGHTDSQSGVDFIKFQPDPQRVNTVHNLFMSCPV